MACSLAATVAVLRVLRMRGLGRGLLRGRTHDAGKAEVCGRACVSRCVHVRTSRRFWQVRVCSSALQGHVPAYECSRANFLENPHDLLCPNA